MCIEAVVGCRRKIGPLSIGKVWGRLDPADLSRRSVLLCASNSRFSDYSEVVALVRDKATVVVAECDGAIIYESFGQVLQGDGINSSKWRGKLRYRDGEKRSSFYPLALLEKIL